MPHLDFVALREPVTCTLPTDPPEHKRLVRQFRRLELERFADVQRRLVLDKEDPIAVQSLMDLTRYALEGVTDAELSHLGLEDLLRLMFSAQGKGQILEDALGNARSGGGASTPKADPPPIIPDSTQTTPLAPSLVG